MFSLANLLSKNKAGYNDDLRIIRNWAEYTDDQKTMKYLMFELEMEEPNGQIVHFYKAIKLMRIIRLPKSAKQSEAFMDMHAEILSGVWLRNIKLVTLIANMLKPEPAIGLMFCYGVQGIAQDINSAKEKADLDFSALSGALQGTYRVLEFRLLNYRELEWLREKMFTMKNLTVVRGIPKAKDGGVDAGNAGLGGTNVNPNSEDTTEEFIAGMVDHEYIVEVLSSPVKAEHLERWLEQSSKEMTKWNKQLQGNTTINFGVSIPMMYMANLGASEGWSHSYSDASSYSETQSDTFSTSYSTNVGEGISHSTGESIGKSIGSSITDSYGQSHSISEGQSHNLSHGISSNESWGESIGHSIGENFGLSENASHGNSINASESDGTSHSDTLSHSDSQGTSASHSTSTSTSTSHSVSDGTSKSTSHTEGSSHSEGTSHTVGSSHTQGTSSSSGGSSGGSSGWSNSSTHSEGTSNSSSSGESSQISRANGTSSGSSISFGRGNSSGSTQSNTSGTTTSESNGTNSSSSSGMTDGSTVGAGFAGISGSSSASSTSSSSSGSSHSTSEGTTTSESNGTTSSQSNSSSLSGSVSTNSSLTTGSGRTNTVSTGTTASNGTSSGTSGSTSWGSSWSNGSSESWGTSESSGTSTSNGTSVSDSTSTGTTHSVSNSTGKTSSVGNTTGVTNSFSDSTGISDGISHSNSFGEGESWSTGNGSSWGTSSGSSASTSHSKGIGTSESEGWGESSSESWGESQSKSYGKSQSDSYSQSTSNGVNKSWGESKGVSSGSSQGTSRGQSLGQSMGVTGGMSTATSATMGLGPSMGYAKSYQWLDQEVKNILTLLEFQNMRLMKALRGNGAFFTDLYIATMDDEAKSKVSILAKTAWNNTEAMICPLQVLDLSPEEQSHLLYHFSAFSADNTKENLEGKMESYKYTTILLPDEFTAYTHLPRISEGGIFADAEDIPKFAVPSSLRGDIYMGKIISAERYSVMTGNETPFEYRLDESELMHGIFTGESRSGKTVGATRFISEATKLVRKKTGKRLRIVALDPKQDWRILGKFVEPERFHFYSLGNPDFLPINLNICKVPHNVYPQTWIDGIIEIYCRNYGLMERGKSILAETFYELYEEAGVFEDAPNWRDFVPERSAAVTLPKIYDRMMQHKVELDDPTKSGKGRAGNEARDAYTRVLDRLQVFGRKFSLETRLFGQPDGIGIDELIGKDDVIVLESYGLESTFKNFIFGCITSGFFKYAQGHEGGFLADDQYETVLVIEEANEVLTGSDTGANAGASPGFGGQSEFEKILDQSAGLGLFVFSITQKIADMPSSVIANSGLIFAGKISRPDDVTIVVRKIGREERIDNRDIVKWFPRSPIGWFVCRSSRNFNFKDVEPVLVHVDPLNVSPPSNEELRAIVNKRKAMNLLQD